jgi:hypothetical protein
MGNLHVRFDEGRGALSLASSPTLPTAAVDGTFGRVSELQLGSSVPACCRLPCAVAGRGPNVLLVVGMRGYFRRLDHRLPAMDNRGLSLTRPSHVKYLLV